MRTKFFVLLSLFVWQTAFALTPAIPPLEVRPEHSGSWYNPDQSGHGFSIEVISEERSIAFWYTYDSSGKPIFLLADGKNFGKKIEATVYYFEGMIWGEFDPADNQRQEWGTLEIEFHDCQNATLAYNPTMPGFSAGEMPLYQLASNEHLRCGESPMAGFYSIALTDDIQSAFVRGMGVLDFDGRLTASFSPKNDMFFDAKIDFTGARNGTAVLSGDSAFIEGDSFSVGPVYLPGWYNPDVITLYSTNFKIEMHHYTGLSATHIEQEAISGDWRLEMTGSGEEWYDVTIESDGSFQFTDGAACLWVGKMTVSKPGFALLDVEAQPTQCDSSVPMQKSTGIYMRQGLHEGADTIRVAFFDEDVGPMFFELIRFPNPLK